MKLLLAAFCLAFGGLAAAQDTPHFEKKGCSAERSAAQVQKVFDGAKSEDEGMVVDYEVDPPEARLEAELKRTQEEGREIQRQIEQRKKENEALKQDVAGVQENAGKKFVQSDPYKGRLLLRRDELKDRILPEDAKQIQQARARENGFHVGSGLMSLLLIASVGLGLGLAAAGILPAWVAAVAFGGSALAALITGIAFSFQSNYAGHEEFSALEKQKKDQNELAGIEEEIVRLGSSLDLTQVASFQQDFKVSAQLSVLLQSHCNALTCTGNGAVSP